MSNSKIITYDLRAPGRNYDDLIAAIKSYKRWVKVTESCWVVVTENSCSSIRDTLTKHIDSNDRLFVATLSGEAAWRNAMCGSDSLKNHL